MVSKQGNESVNYKAAFRPNRVLRQKPQVSPFVMRPVHLDYVCTHVLNQTVLHVEMDLKQCCPERKTAPLFSFAAVKLFFISRPISVKLLCATGLSPCHGVLIISPQLAPSSLKKLCIFFLRATLLDTTDTGFRWYRYVWSLSINVQKSALIECRV